MYRMRSPQGLSGTTCADLTEDDFYAANGAQSCGPTDTACVNNNLRIQQAYQAFWASCNPDSAAGVNPNQLVGNPAGAIAQPGEVFVSGPQQTLQQAANQIYGGTAPPSTFQYVAPPSPPAPSPQAPPPPTIAVNSTLKPSTTPVVISSSGPSSKTPSENVYQSSSIPPTIPTAPPSAPPPTGFSLSSIPWWGWAAGIGVGLYAFSGRR